MKKKLLALVLSVVMLASLLVPMLVISAAGPTAKLGVSNIRKTTRNDVSGNPVDVIAIDINVSENSDYFFTGRFLLVSEQDVAPFISKQGRNEVKGFDEGNFASSDAKFLYDVTANGTEVVALNKTGFQVLLNSEKGDMGINTASGSLGTYYFVAPTAIGTYTFKLIWLDGTNDGYNEETGANDNVQQYNITLNPETITYTVECTSHNEVLDEENSTAPKCGVPGENVYKCEACGKELRREGVDALEHIWDEGTVDTDVACGDTADTHYECTRPGCTGKKDVTGAVVEHHFVRDEANDVPAKCGVPGATAYKCDRANCPGGADSVKTVPTAALEHKYEKDEAQCTAPRCGVPGEDVLVCENANCPESIKRVPVAALEHDWDEGTPVGNVVCGQTADIIYHCKNANCPNPERTETGAVVEHNLVRDEANDVAPKCGVPGSKAYKCDRDGCPGGADSVKTEPVAALEHKYEKDEAQSTAPRCGVPGEDVFGCQNANCPEPTYTKPVAALEHDWEYSDELSEEPKCGVPGKNVYVCQNANCPDGTMETPINALEHDYDYDYYSEMYDIVPPTADVMGTAKVPCFNECGEYKVVDLEKLSNEVGDKDASIKAEDNILPEDVTFEIIDGKEEDGKVEVSFEFSSNIIADLEGGIEFSLSIAEAKKDYKNFAAYILNADGSKTPASEIVGDNLVIKADLKDTILLTYEEIPATSPETGDNFNVVVLAALALIAVAGLVFVGKKRFSL